jgi:hypothetical protein
MTTLPGKAASSALGLDKQIGLRWLNIALVILLAATMLSLPGGNHAIHGVGGLFMLIGCGIHLARHGRWINAVILETPNNITPFLRRQRRLFWGMLLSGLFCGLSGLVALPVHIHASPLHCCVIPFHASSGIIFIGLTIYHLVLHKNWFRKNLAIFSTASKR